MLTPQEVAEHAFAKASFNGYNMAQVDDFLDEVTRDYETLYNDNTLLKQKLGVLTGKIKEYQSTEEAMRKTLLTAQTMADEMVKEAEAKRDALIGDAERESHARIAALELEERTERERLRTAQEATERYVASVRALLNQETMNLDSLDRITPAATPKPAPPPTARDSAGDIFEAVAEAVEREERESFEVTDAPEADDLPSEKADDAPTLRFNPPDDENAAVNGQGKRTGRSDKLADLGLNFGKEYELK